MFGPLARIKEEFTSMLPAFGNTNVILRGLAVPIDTFLDGNVRFGKKIGAFLPYVLPDNQTRLSSAIQERSDTLVVEALPSWFAVGVLIQVGGLEIKRVSDVDTDSNTLMLESVLENAYEKLTEILLHAVPITVKGDIPASSIDVVIDPTLPRLKNQADGFGPFSVDGSYFVYNGDVLSILRDPDNLYSMRNLEVTKSTVTDVATKTTEVYVDKTVFDPANVFTDNTVIYLRAYPAYESNILPLPEEILSDSFGPFLVDWHSGMLRNLGMIREVFTLSGYSVSSPTPITGPEIVTKNHPVTEVPIHNSSMLTWDLINGTMNRRPGWTSAVLDSEGRFAVSTFLVPKFEAPARWVLNVIPKTTSVDLLYQFEPNAQVKVTLIPDVNNNVVIDLTGQDASRLEIAVLGTAGAEVLFGDFVVHGAYIQRVKYTMVAQVYGRYPYACSGVVIKPMFRTIENLYMNSTDGRTNAGQILAERGY